MLHPFVFDVKRSLNGVTTAVDALGRCFFVRVYGSRTSQLVNKIEQCDDLRYAHGPEASSPTDDNFVVW